MDTLVTNRCWTALKLDPAATLHDVRWGEHYSGNGLDEFVWVLQISGAAPASHFVDGYRGASSDRQPPMYFPLGGGTLKGVGRPGKIVWSRVFVEGGSLHVDMGLGSVVALPAEETERRWKQTTTQWPMVSATFDGVSRNAFMARHRANHVNIAYAPGRAAGRPGARRQSCHVPRTRRARASLRHSEARLICHMVATPDIDVSQVSGHARSSIHERPTEANQRPAPQAQSPVRQAPPQAHLPRTASPVSIVAGVDFGTLSVRVSLFSKSEGRLGSGVAEYPLRRSPQDPNLATQSHHAQMEALERAMRSALRDSHVNGDQVRALALDATGSSVIPVGQGADGNLEPLDDYYLWCDHRAWREAEEITAAAHRQGIEAIAWCGGVYSSEWGFSKLLHWLRHNPDKRTRFVTALENCDMAVATLCGITSLADLPRSICAMGHKWMWNAKWGGLPSQEFLTSVDPLFARHPSKARRPL